MKVSLKVVIKLARNFSRHSLLPGVTAATSASHLFWLCAGSSATSRNSTVICWKQNAAVHAAARWPCAVQSQQQVIADSRATYNASTGSSWLRSVSSTHFMCLCAYLCSCGVIVDLAGDACFPPDHIPSVASTVLLHQHYIDPIEACFVVCT